jgi:hypothetical protein
MSANNRGGIRRRPVSFPVVTIAKRLAVLCLVGATVGLLAAAAIGQGTSTILVTKVTSFPSSRGPLVSQKLNTVTAPRDLSFRIVLRNGNLQRHHLTVTLKIRRPASAASIVRTKSLSRLGSNQAASLTFGNLGNMAYAQRQTLKLTIADAQRREVWVRTYPVIFALP